MVVGAVVVVQGVALELVWRGKGVERCVYGDEEMKKMPGGPVSSGRVEILKIKMQSWVS